MVLKRLHLLLAGRVQGVWFRASTRRKARELGLTGRVWNRPDGRVEIVAEGPEKGLLELLEWAGIGPPGARVEKVESRWQAATGEFSGFEIS